ncbi:MAG TPA: hypothetical protein VGP80_08675 [Gemmatimonadales bacterium]|jgi:hypothetical protein|nr:hypothetical protein [Gemmatimonadales bacterium]
MSPKKLFAVSAFALAALVAACSDTSSPTGPMPVGENGRPQFATGGPTAGVVDTGEFEVCKHGTSATFTYSVSGGPVQSVTLADGGCAVLANTETLGAGTIAVTATESADPTVVLDSIVATINSIRDPVGVRGAPITGTDTYSGTFNGDRGTLVEFYNSPVPPPPPPSCTFTVGYWKNHTTVWPAPYSPGATFYTSGKTWLQVLNTPTQGNAYYILAYQFIAATLNGTGSAPANVQQAMVDAGAYFANPAGSSLTRAQLIAMGTLLDNYNNGLLGTPHCP